VIRRTETLALLLAVTLASLGTLHFTGHSFLTLGAIAVIALVAAVRLRAALTGRRTRTRPESAIRAERIREERDKRFRR